MKENRDPRQKTGETGKGLPEEVAFEATGSPHHWSKALTEEAFRALFETSIDGILLARPDGRVNAANPAACKTLGMTEEEVIRAGRERILNLKDPRAASGLEERARTGKAEGEVTFLRKDRLPFPVEFQSRIYRDKTGEPYAFTIFRDITERRWAEEALRKSEDRFATLFHASPVAFAISRIKDNRLVDVNPAWEKMTGFSREEAIGHTSRELNILVNPRLREEIIQNLRKTGTEVNFEAQIRHKSGGVIEVLMSAKLIEMSGERYALRLAQNTTGVKQIERTLRESEERYRMVVEDQTELISRFLPDGRITFVNKVYCRFFGKTSAELIGKKWQPLAVAEDLPRIEAQLGALAPDNPVAIIENRVYSGSGQVRWMQFVNRGLFDSEGKLREIQKVGRDITERKRLEEELKESVRFQRAVFDALSANVAVIDSRGKILDVNKAWREFAAANPPVLENVCEGANYLQVCASAKGPHSSQAIPFLKAIRKVLSGELEYFEMEYPCHSPGKKRWFLGRVTPFAGDGSRRAVIAHENITVRKQAERAIQLYQKNLRGMASKMILAAQGERRRLASEVHDRIGQNLALVKIKLGGISKMKISPKGKARIGEIDKLMEEAIQGVRALIFGISPPVLYDLGLEAAVEWAAEDFQEQHRIPVELRIKGKPQFLREELRTLFFRALRELLTNIAKHSRAKKVKIHLENEKDLIRLTVMDDGVGFRPSSSGNRLRKKSFGLFNIQEQFKSMGAQFKMVSFRGKGTKAILTASPKPRKRPKGA